MGTVTGKDASISIWGGAAAKGHALWALSDFSLTFDRGIVEQELVGQTGNWFDYGALSVEGSYTNCRFGASGNSDTLDSIVASSFLNISGNTGANLSWWFVSAQVTSYEVVIGDADTISEASVDFVILDPFRVAMNTSTGHITDRTG